MEDTDEALRHLPSGRPDRVRDWVLVMADYSSDGLWERGGCMMCAEDLPVSADVSARLEAWCLAYEAGQLWKEPSERKGEPFDMASFSSEGLLVARAIKAALPGWTVFYHDEAKSWEADPADGRETYEHEVGVGP